LGDIEGTTAGKIDWAGELPVGLVPDSVNDVCLDEALLLDIQRCLPLSECIANREQRRAVRVLFVFCRYQRLKR
jgi:hypothetical protein